MKSWQPADTAPFTNFRDRIYLTDDPKSGQLWMGWREPDGWHDAMVPIKNAQINLSPRIPTHWLMDGNGIPWRVPGVTKTLPDEMNDAGKQFMKAVEHKKIPAQGLMWNYFPDIGWKYMLVVPDGTPDVKKRVDEIFNERIVSQAMVLEDVMIVGPNEPIFRILAKNHKIGRGNCEWHHKGDEFVGSIAMDNGSLLKYQFRCNAVVYRALETLDGSDFKRPEELSRKIKEALSA